MLLKADHYTSLARAVARADRGSYEARGAVYDRALTALVKRLNTAVPPYSHADIEMELLAFREAVRRVEFGDLEDSWLRQQDERLAAPEQPPIRPRGVLPDDVASPGVAARAVADPSQAEPPMRVILPQHRSVFGRVAARAAIAALIVGLGVVGYAHGIGELDLSSLATRFLDQFAALQSPSAPAGRRLMDTAAVERAVYYEQEGSGAAATELAAKAAWGTRFDRVDPGGEPEAVVALEVEIPQRGFSLAMSVRRDASPNAAMSHLFELQFEGSNTFSVDRIESVTGVSLKGIDEKNSEALLGQVIKVAPGLFLFGLIPGKVETQRNVQLLRTMPRMDIPITFADGKAGTIAVEKGASGARVFEDVFNRWAQ